MIGRPRLRPLVEDVDWIEPGDVPPDSPLLLVELRPLPGGKGVAPVRFLRCPLCDARRRALFKLDAGLACRRCAGLRYQSQAHGRWDFGLLERLQRIERDLASRPGPKGRRYRVWQRRLMRVNAQVDAWLRRFQAREAPEIRRAFTGSDLRQAGRGLSRLASRTSGRLSAPEPPSVALPRPAPATAAVPAPPPVARVARRDEPCLPRPPRTWGRLLGEL